jgi:hypothetical protein
MNLFAAVKGGVNRALRPFDLQLVRRRQITSAQVELRSLRERLEKFLPSQAPPSAPESLPREAQDYLRPDNPRLIELRSRYASADCPAVAHSLWNACKEEIDLKSFRADNPYIFQHRDGNAEINYLFTAAYLKSIDALDLFRTLEEDGAFGACVFSSDDTLLSRDLLDSISEIAFLESVLGISRMHHLTVLDIGAGYGRLAHRMSVCLPRAKILCTDAVAESTFLSEFYLRFRRVSNAQVVPLDEIAAVLQHTNVDLAVNIHSFTECTLDSISWWLDLVSSQGIRYLFIVPNAESHGGTRLMSRELDLVDQKDFMPAILARGYRLIAQRAKYASLAVQKHGVSPTHYYLFEKLGAPIS